MRSAFLRISLLVGTVLLCSSSLAQEEQSLRGFEIGTLRLLPHVDFQQRYESNFLYRPKGEELDDFITIGTFGLAVEQSIANRHAVRVFGNTSYYRYLDNSDYNHLDRRFGGELELNFRKFDLELADLYWISSQPVFPEELGLVKRTGHRSSLSSTVRLNRLTLYPRHQHDVYTYDEPSDFLNRRENTFEVRGEYRISRKTALISVLEHRIVSFDDDFIYDPKLSGLRKDLTLNKLTLGMSKVLTNRIAGELQVGLEQIDAREREFDDAVKPFASLSLGGELPRIGQVDLMLEHNVEPSLSVNYTYFEWDRVTLGLNRRLSRKIEGSTHVSYQILSYPETKILGTVHPDYDVHRKVFDVGLKYKIQEWLSTSVQYTFRDSRSKVAEDWVNHRLDFSVGARF